MTQAEDNLEKGIRQTAIELGDRASHDAYIKLCDKWGVEPQNNIERIFKAAFVSGAHCAISMMIEATKD